MQIQFKYITDLAKQYQAFSDDKKLVFESLNQLSHESLLDIFNEFGDPDRDFKPVNFVRAEVARRLLSGEQINEILVEEIKEKVRTKETAYITHYKSALI